MNIFISQTEGKSQDVAKVLQTWLKEDMKIGEPWMSPDIPGGEDWRIAIGKALKKARFGILCVTTDNLKNQWMLFEAGALYIKGVTIFPYVLDLDKLGDIPSPISNVKAKRTDKEGTKSLILGIVEALYPNLDERAKETSRVEEIFDVKWEILKNKLDKIYHRKDAAYYEKVLKDFVKIMIYINSYRKALDFSPVVDDIINSLIKQNYNSNEVVHNLYEKIEVERERFNRNTILVENVRDFFKKHFDEPDLRKIIIRMEQSILFTDSELEQKRRDLLLQIKKEESKIYLRYHQKLADKLRDELL